MAQKRAMVILCSVLFLSGCIGLTDPGQNNRSYGFLLMDTQLAGGGYAAEMHATFFRGQTLNLPSVVPAQDQCVVAPYQFEDPEFELPTSVPAGDEIPVRLSGNEFVLSPEITGPLLRYYPPGHDLVPFQPGDTVHIDVPGSTYFPEWSLSGRTAEPFTFESIDVSAEEAPLSLSWTLPTSENSKMLVSLRYSTQTFPDRLAEQIFCELRDDGSFDVPQGATTGWRNAPNDLREGVFARWRVTIEERGEATMIILSTFLVPTPDSHAQLSDRRMKSLPGTR